MKLNTKLKTQQMVPSFSSKSIHYESPMKLKNTLYKKQTSINLESTIQEPSKISSRRKRTSIDVIERQQTRTSLKFISMANDETLKKQKTPIIFRQYQPQIQEFTNADNSKQVKTMFKVSVGSCNTSVCFESPQKLKEKDNLVEVINQKFLLKGPSQKLVYVPQGPLIVKKGIMSNAAKLYNIARRRASMQSEKKAFQSQQSMKLI